MHVKYFALGCKESVFANHAEIQRTMEGRFCVLSDTEDFQTLLSNNATNLCFERYDAFYAQLILCNIDVARQCRVVVILIRGVALHFEVEHANIN